MAIIIPSKKIYQNKNPKVRDNFIDNVSVEVSTVVTNNEYDISVYNTRIEESTLFSESYREDKIAKMYPSSEQMLTPDMFGATYVLASRTYLICDLKIPILKTNSYIDSLILQATDKDGNAIEKVGYAIYGKTKTGNVTIPATINHGVLGVESYSFGTLNLNGLQSGGVVETFSKEILEKNLYTAISSSGGVTSASSRVVFENETNIKTLSYRKITENKVDYFIIKDVKILIGTKQYKASWTSGNPYSSGTTTAILTGTGKEYNPERIEITIYGNTIGVSIESYNINYQSGNKPSTISGNEILQDSATTSSFDIYPTTEFLSKLVLENYKNGKETASLLCSIGEYKNQSGKVVISEKITNEKIPMTFRIGDIVIPYILSSTGVDIPMSKYKDGKPKEFKVVKIEIIDDGAVWQELTLQEYTKITV